MEIIFRTINGFFSAVFMPFVDMRPEYALLIISFVTGASMLYLYKWTSNRESLRREKQHIKAGILEIQLYKTDLYIMIRGLFRVFIRNLAYMRLLIAPALLLTAIVLLILLQCYPRFAYRPVRPGEGVTLKADLTNWGKGAAHPVELLLPKGVTIDAGPVAVPSLKEIDWRLKARTTGDYTLVIQSGNERQEKNIRIGYGIERVTPSRSIFTYKNLIGIPMEKFLSPASAFKEITVTYPEREIHSKILLGMNWMFFFFVVSFATALVLKFLVKVE